MIANLGIRRLRLAGITLVLVGVALGLGGSAASADDTLGYGVSKTESGAGLAIHWVVCPGEAPRTVDVGEDVGGSRPAAGVPLFWQIRSDRPANGATTVETYVVGETPPGFYETIPVWEPLPTRPEDLVSISSPPGGAASTGGMGFALQDLPTIGIYRGDYQVVSDEQFAQDGARACGPTSAVGSISRWIALVLLCGALAFLAATVSRRTMLITTAVVIATSAVALGSLASRPEVAVGAREAAAAFSPSSADVPAGGMVLADLSPRSPSVHEETGGVFVARFIAPGDYAFVVSCGGRSLQIGESSAIPNGGTGSRQVIGCADRYSVRSSIGWRPDRARVVEVVVFTNGAIDWHLVVVAGAGTIGPFDQP